jgi:peptidoglycan/LPS O-acetylase OafA/YrhL
VSATVGHSEPVAAPLAPASREVSRDLPNLDFMRALAVLLVVADHVLETTGALVGRSFSPFDWYLGRMGVLMFFVHTSLVLMMSMDRSRARGPAFFTTFYLRRAFRIYPLSIACVLIVLALGAPPIAWTHDPSPVFSAFDVAGNLLLIQNLVDADLVLSPLWSLPLELQMYAVLPILYLLLRTSAPVSRAWLLWALAVAGALLQPHVPGGGRLSVAAFGPCFMAGVLAYTLLPRTAPRWPAAAWAMLLAGVTTAYVAVASASPVVHPPWLGWLYCLVIGLAIPRFVQFTHAGVRGAALAIAKYSYGVYLFHMLALWIGLGPTSPWPLGPVPGSLVALALVVVAPVVSFHLIEQPMIGVGTRLAGRLTPRPA